MPSSVQKNGSSMANDFGQEIFGAIVLWIVKK
jgi:hypothetical protein